MKTAIVGGGAAGFFLAVNLKEMVPAMDITIFERSKHVLAKVRISGGGRCNCTNTFEGVGDLATVYPRGHRLLKRLFKQFDHRDAFDWFEHHGVELTIQPDHCVFPRSQNSESIINCFLNEARRQRINIVTGQRIDSFSQLDDFDFVAVTMGGAPRAGMMSWLEAAGHKIESPVPSLFTFSIADEALRALMGTVIGQAAVMIPGTRFRASGPLLVTHWGMSGPAILRLSSYAARHLHDSDYKVPLSVNWSGMDEASLRQSLSRLANTNERRQVRNARPDHLPQRLWDYLLGKSIPSKAQSAWRELGNKDFNRLVNVLCNDTFLTAGRAAFKDEFVTCGGISLQSVNPTTLESRSVPHLYFAGEVLDIDGVTGGFNFQAAWTTAFAVAKAIAAVSNSKNRQP